MIPPRSRFGRHALALLLAAAVFAGGCFGIFERQKKGAGSAVWLSAESGEITDADLARLQSAGMHELFVEVAELEWSGITPSLAPLPPARLPRRAAVTLVVRGRWPSGELDPQATAKKLADLLQSLRIESEGRGLLPVGFHFDVEASGQLESYAKTLAKLDALLEGGPFLSVTVGRRWLDQPQIERVAKAADFVVCFLYGQRPGAEEDPQAWDLQAVEANLRRLEKLGRKYFLGVITLGSASHLGRGGEVLGYETALSLAPLVANPALELKHGFTLQGIDRLVYDFNARGPTQVGDWRVAPGESVRVVKTATPFLEEFLRRAGAWELPNRLGQVYYRLPRAVDRLSLSLANLASALEPEPATPLLEVRLEPRVRSEKRWLLRLELENKNDETTDIAMIDNNYVEIRAQGGTFADVDLGDFRRFDLLKGEEKNTLRAVREADTVRLFLPILEGREVARTGDIEVRVSGRAPVLTVAPTFLLPDGRVLAPEPREFTFGNP
jgi:hypothetical protein